MYVTNPWKTETNVSPLDMLNPLNPYFLFHNLKPLNLRKYVFWGHIVVLLKSCKL